MENLLYKTMKKTILFFLILSCILPINFSFAEQEDASIEVKVAVLKDFPPQYSLSKYGQPQGFAIDLIESVAEIANFKIKYLIKENWQEMFEAMQNREADMIPNMGVTDRRKALFSFSRPVETFPVSIFVRESEDNISNIQSLSGKNVGVIALNVGEILLKNHPDVIPKIYEHIEDGLFGLLSGNIDALVYPEPVLWIMARNAGIDDRIKPVGEPLIEISRAISVHKTNQYLLKKIDAAVAEFVNSETYKKIYTRWYGKPKPFWTVPKVAGFMTAILIFSITGMGVWRYHSTMKLNQALLKNIQKREAAERKLQESYDTLEKKIDERTKELQKALSEVKSLSGLLPICAHCKKIRDDQGYWNSIEEYIYEHSEAEFSHSICQECAKKHYPDMDIYEK